LPIMLGFMAFAIDIGRLRVARVQVQGAADAAAIAALAELRAGRSTGDAETAALSAANAVRLQGVESTEPFAVDVSYGDWDYGSQSWSAGAAQSGVTVNVTQVAPLNLLFAPIFEAGGVAGRIYGGGLGGDKALHRSLTLGRRASFRPRDIVIVVDTSRAMEPYWDDVQPAIDAFIETVHDFGIPEDRLAIIEFAGVARTRIGLDRLAAEFTDYRQANQDITLCNVGMDAWYYFYRYFDPILDLELDGRYVFDYRTVTPGPQPGTHPLIVWAEDSLEWEFYVDNFDDSATYPGNADVSEDMQCNANYMSYMLFEMFDPRRDRDGDGLFDDASSLIECHEGNALEGVDDRIDYDWGVPELDCIDDDVDIEPGIHAFNGSDDGDPDFEYPDMSYVMAGTSPGEGLLAAASMLISEQPSRGEPTVILITASGPRCGPLIDLGIASDCNDDMLQTAVEGAEALEDLGANTHVLALMPHDSDDVDVLSELTTGRGDFDSSEHSSDLEEMLDVVARDIRIQMVQ
ncbi:MAG TPA: VWA domain-containing protein, partial [Myxococcota bacterium]|nr:VWA domain-containing protein [Myxococcota bacterium]